VINKLSAVVVRRFCVIF